MKVLLIYPPDTNMIRTNVPGPVDDTGHYPPLGLMYVASHLEAHTDHEVTILDTQVAGVDVAGIADHVRTLKPDVVGIQTMTFTLIDAMQTARAVKSVSPDIHVCFGGPHVNIYPAETLGLGVADSLVLGEGEQAFTDLVDALAARKDISNIPGVAVKSPFGSLGAYGARPLLADLDQLPFPARHLTPVAKYWSVLAQREPITTMMTSRGCPFQCVFCDRPHLGKQFRCRSARSVVDEMQACHEMGIREIFFYDDTFTVNRKRVIEITEAIRVRGLKIAWDVRAHVGTVDREVLQRMKAAGCSRIHYGVESGNEEILKSLKKGTTIEAVERAFAETRDAGITTLAYFMIGSPGESRDQILETLSFAKRIRADYVHTSVLVPFPATEVYVVGQQRGLYTRDYWREFAANPTPEFVPPVWEEHLTREELIELLHFAYKDFYGRPSYILHSLARVRSFPELARKAIAGWRLLTMSHPNRSLDGRAER